MKVSLLVLVVGACSCRILTVTRSAIAMRNSREQTRTQQTAQRNFGREAGLTTTHSYLGGCHCGNLAFRFEASAPLETLGLRADQCSFCRAHGARNTS